MTGPPDPEEVTAGRGPAVAEVPSDTRLGAVHLTVGDLERSARFWEATVGLRVQRRGGGRAALGAGGEDLVVLEEEPGARPARRTAGLYHLALLLPERSDLARWLAHAARNRVRLAGLSDHAVSEAIYLSDPDEHGIEIYWDRPRAGWEGRVAERLTTLPLDVDGLLGELGDPAAEPFAGLPAGTTMGHVHLRVGDVPTTVRFYRDVLGLGLMAALPGAAFLSAGGYHHHVGANTWESAGAGQAPPGTAALRHATVVLPDAAARDRLAGQAASAGHPAASHGDEGDVLVRDPSGNGLVLTAA